MLQKETQILFSLRGRFHDSKKNFYDNRKNALTCSEIAEKIGVHRSQVHRLLVNQLVPEGLVKQVKKPGRNPVNAYLLPSKPPTFEKFLELKRWQEKGLLKKAVEKLVEEEKIGKKLNELEPKRKREIKNKIDEIAEEHLNRQEKISDPNFSDLSNRLKICQWRTFLSHVGDYVREIAYLADENIEVPENEDNDNRKVLFQLWSLLGKNT